MWLEPIGGSGPRVARSWGFPCCVQQDGLSADSASPWVLSSFFFIPYSCLPKAKKNVVTGKLTSAVTNRMTSTSKRNFSASSGRNPGKDLDTLCALWRSESLPLASISIWRTRGTVRMQTRHGPSPKEEILVSTYVCCLLYNFDSSHFGEWITIAV